MLKDRRLVTPLFVLLVSLIAAVLFDMLARGVVSASGLEVVSSTVRPVVAPRPSRSVPRPGEQVLIKPSDSRSIGAQARRHHESVMRLSSDLRQ
ncbi:hypothetical protein [Mesorhizobium sp. M0239]|uniref:hypothetical protein n=1 Tax=unclassified Mesorhizobium TaxID=325217 RepID=UPI00333B0821